MDRWKLEEWAYSVNALGGEISDGALRGLNDAIASVPRHVSLDEMWSAIYAGVTTGKSADWSARHFAESLRSQDVTCDTPCPLNLPHHRFMQRIVEAFA